MVYISSSHPELVCVSVSTIMDCPASNYCVNVVRTLCSLEYFIEVRGHCKLRQECVQQPFVLSWEFRLVAVKRPEGLGILERRWCSCVMGRRCEVMPRFMSLRAVFNYGTHTEDSWTVMRSVLCPHRSGTSRSVREPRLLFLLLPVFCVCVYV